MPKLLRLFVFTFLTVLLSGCKIAAIVVEGGSLLTRGNCDTGKICVYEVTRTDFEQSFVAWPEAGWIFDHWQAGDGFLCGDRRQETCIVSLRSLEEETAEKIISSSETAYIMPIFRRAKDIIEADGKEWYQPYLFVGLSWNEINEVCPDGTCTGMLKGQDMNGWTWASVKDMNDLFNYYIGSDSLGPGPDFAEDIGNAQSSLLFDGWHLTYRDASFALVGKIVGLVKDSLNTDPNLVWCAVWAYIGIPLENLLAVTNCKVNKDINKYPYATGAGLPSIPPYGVGAWFYRVT